jgi:hypothetical protein
MTSSLRSTDHIGDEAADVGVKLHRQPPPPPSSAEDRRGLAFMAATLPATPLARQAPPALGGVGTGNSRLLGAAFDVSLLAMKANKHGCLSDEDLVLLNHHTDAIRHLSVTYLRSSSPPSSPSSPSTVVDVPEQQYYSSPSSCATSSSTSSSSSASSSATNNESRGAPLVRLQGEQLLASAHAHDAFVGQCAPAIRKRRNRWPEPAPWRASRVRRVQRHRNGAGAYPDVSVPLTDHPHPLAYGWPRFCVTHYSGGAALMDDQRALRNMKRGVLAVQTHTGLCPIHTVRSCGTDCATRAVCDSATRCASTERRAEKRISSPTTPTTALRVAVAQWRVGEGAARKLRHHRREGGRPSTASSTDVSSAFFGRKATPTPAFRVDVACIPLAHGQQRPRQPGQ